MGLHATKLCAVKFKPQAINPHTLRLQANFSPEGFKGEVKGGLQMPGCVHLQQQIHVWGFPGGAVVENLPANAGVTGSSPGLGRSHVPRSD